MKLRALIVEDTTACLGDYYDVLDSMGHEYDVVGSQKEAREALARNDYSYVLLDMQIPVEEGRISRIKNGENLLREIVAGNGPMVIITTGYGKESDGTGWAVDLMALGAAGFIHKGFPEKGRTLEVVIEQALARRTQKLAPTITSEEEIAEDLPAFDGGELAFHLDHATLCGVKIITGAGRGHSMMILEQLSRTEGRKYVRMSAEDLADGIHVLGVTETVTSCVSHLRQNITKRLRENGVANCGPRDVIEHNTQGYFLRDWVIVPDAQVIKGCDYSWMNGRQKWAVDAMGNGGRVTRKMVENRFRVAEKTAKRDFAELQSQGITEFIGKPWPGYYRLSAR